MIKKFVIMTMPHYQNVNAIFNSSDYLPSAAEAHGLICGFICAGNKMDGKSWLDPILAPAESESKELLSSCKLLLLELYEMSCIKLQSFDFEFELLLPDDEQTLQYRAEALSHWCQGFIVAMNRAGISEPEMHSEDAKDALKHIFEISKLNYESIDVSEKDEQAYAEVMEYVRMAVLMVYSEIAVEQERGGNNTNGHQFH